MIKKEQQVSRRHFIKGIAATGFGAGAILNLEANNTTTSQKEIPRKKAKNLILMVSDGMNNGLFSATNHWLNLTANKDSEWMKLYKDGLAERRLVETSCADAMVTDSAAASSAWGIGERVNHRVVNILPDGRKPKPLAILAKEKGKLAGMVTTARITHATPAGFAANMSHRDLDDQIAEQYLDRKIDLLLGGGDKHFNPSKRKDGVDLYSKYKEADYEIVRSQKELHRANLNKPVLGVFYNDHFPFCIDRENQKQRYDSVPSLEKMTTAALNKLSKNKEGFVLQIEAARVDHAAHANDAGTALREQLEFDRTIKIVREFAEKNGETMVVVTTDHGTGGFMINRSEKGYVESGDTLLKLGKFTGSFESMTEKIDYDRLEQTLIPAVETTYGIELSGAHKESLLKVAKMPKKEALYGGNKLLADVLKPIVAEQFGISWTTHHHTGDLVEMAMYGPGSDVLPGYIENWETHKIFREYLGI